MSWDQMTSILTEGAGYAELEKTEPPKACPFDGEPLSTSPRGGLFCKLGNYEWPRMRRII